MLVSAGVRLFAPLVSTSSFARSRTPDETAGRDLLRRLVDATGGELTILERWWPPFPRAEEEEKLVPDTRRMIAEIMESYYLTVRLSEPVGKQQGWKLEVVKPEGFERSRLMVLYPNVLAACQEADRR